MSGAPGRPADHDWSPAPVPPPPDRRRRRRDPAHTTRLSRPPGSTGQRGRRCIARGGSRIWAVQFRPYFASFFPRRPASELRPYLPDRARVFLPDVGAHVRMIGPRCSAILFRRRRHWMLAAGGERNSPFVPSLPDVSSARRPRRRVVRPRRRAVNAERWCWRVTRILLGGAACYALPVDAAAAAFASTSSRGNDSADQNVADRARHLCARARAWRPPWSLPRPRLRRRVALQSTASLG